jgi:hypothetical protein
MQKMRMIPTISKKIEIYTGYIDSVDILIHFPYPSSIDIKSGLLYTTVDSRLSLLRHLL